ncbi:hypothetical protein [Fodinicola feengrottensis]|uniref:hypothetical protein n=1 Tax=Fodinicola feengrottensis TaxID=435914 RepID=UPI002441A834|nr:hypothetical protein [Fodinicola feengrottensis]
MSTNVPPAPVRLMARLLPIPAGAGLARMLFERNVLVYRRGWVAFVSGFLEPVFYLFSLGIGLGALIGSVNYGGGSSCRMRRLSRPPCWPPRP